MSTLGALVIDTIFLVGGLLIGYCWGEARGIRATEKRWSEAVRRAAWPRRALNRELPPGERISGDWDQPNGKCSSCGAPLNSHMMGGYRLHQHLTRPPDFNRSCIGSEASKEWMR